MLKKSWKKLSAFISLISFIFIFINCENDPVTTQQEHLKAEGIIFLTSGIEIARIYHGETSDTLIAPLDSLSDHLDVKFLDENENEIEPPSSNQNLSWVIDNENIVDVWQHEGEEGSFEFHLKGLQVGETKIEFFVFHNDHSDFRSGKIPVKVEN